MEAVLYRGLMRDPADFADLDRWLTEGRLDPDDLIGILGKTEGNGGRNDFSRELATRAAREVWAAHREKTAWPEPMWSFSGGTEGVITPHYLAMARKGTWPVRPSTVKRLAIARGQTRSFAPNEIGGMAMIEETARLVRQLAAQARIDPEDVHFVHVKGALHPAGDREYPRNTMAYARGASALGVAWALGEIDPGTLNEASILGDWTLYSRRASTSAKPGLLQSDILVMGNSPWWSGPLVSGHAVMRDMLDLTAVQDALRPWGLTSFPLSDKDGSRVVAVFAKAEADPRDALRGYRHTMRSDDDISDTRYARCVVGSVLAGLFQSPLIYVSTRAEHHGPPGGGPVAFVVTAPTLS